MGGYRVKYSCPYILYYRDFYRNRNRGSGGGGPLCTYYFSLPSQDQMWLQSELSGSHGSGPGMVRLYPSTSDDTVTSSLLSFS